MRAFVSLALLAGFFLVALAQLGGAVALAYWLSTVVSGLVAVKLTWPILAAVVGSAGVGIWRAVRSKPTPPPGLLVTPEQAPALWQSVHELAAAVGTRPPDDIRLIPEVNAAVSEDAKLLGLITGPRHLYIGLPLLHTLTVAQLRAVLAHELGHYSHSHTRLGAVAYRGRLAIAGTLDRIGPYNVSGWIFKLYARLYVLADNAVSRRQEFEADQAAVRLAGREAAAGALREIPVLDQAWDFFLDRYLSIGWDAGYAPDDLFAGFAAFVQARQGELDELRAEPPDDYGSRWDTHPPIATRVATIQASPDAPAHPDTRPSGVLLPDLAAAGQQLQAGMLDLDGRQMLPWPQFTAAALRDDLQRDSDVVFRTLKRSTGAASLPEVLDQIEAGCLIDLAQPFFPTATRREVGPMFAGPLATLLLLAAVNCGKAGWSHSWSGPAELVPDLGLEQLAELAVSQGGLPAARARLAELGIDPRAAALAEETPTARGSSVLAGLANIKVNGTEFDVIALSEGVVLVPEPGSTEKGTRRLTELVRSVPADELARMYRFIPYEDMASTQVTREVPLKATIGLHSGETLQLKEKMASEFLTKTCREDFAHILRQVG
ncbi:M48 family metalloprotease [Nonomuraea sp. NPDC059194]|uniref:M48 family metalloprotease n=1 Tax=Nonomuraea sp. NPDC059194 TaxID=3346764 RepID=UPI0036BE046E